MAKLPSSVLAAGGTWRLSPLAGLWNHGCAGFPGLKSRANAGRPWRGLLLVGLRPEASLGDIGGVPVIFVGLSRSPPSRQAEVEVIEQRIEGDPNVLEEACIAQEIAKGPVF